MTDTAAARSEGPGRVAMVTGAGSGIGLATARRLAAGGWRVALVGRTRAKLEAAAQDMPAGSAFVAAEDLASPAGSARAVERTVEKFGRLDLLVNNAGVAMLAPIEQTSDAVLTETFAVNALGPAGAIVHTWPIFQRQHKATGVGGCVVNVSTLGTVDPFPGFFAYAASKAAVNLMARSCAKEGAAIGVRAFAVAPGAVETPMLRGLFDEVALPRSLTLPPEAVADVIVGCEAGVYDEHNGGVILVHAGEDGRRVVRAGGT